MGGDTEAVAGLWQEESTRVTPCTGRNVEGRRRDRGQKRPGLLRPHGTGRDSYWAANLRYSSGREEQRIRGRGTNVMRSMSTRDTTHGMVTIANAAV